MKVHDFFELNSFYKTLWLNENPWDGLNHLKKFIASQNFTINSFVPESCFIENPKEVYIGKNVTIEPHVYIKGPCMLMDHSTVRHGAYLRENVLVGSFATIGHAGEIKHSILMDHSSAAHFCYVGDSILGFHVNLGAGVKCANYRLDGEAVEIKNFDESRKKAGAIIGDGSKLGCNAVTFPGTVIGKNVFSYPNTNLRGVIPNNSIVKAHNPSIFQLNGF